MLEVHIVYKRYLKYTFTLLSIYVILWGVTPYKTEALGMVLGSVIGIYNIWLLSKKTARLGEMVLEERGMKSIGTISRMAAAVLAVAIAMRYPDTFNIFFVVMGLMTGYLVIMIDLIIHNIRRGATR